MEKKELQKLELNNKAKLLHTLSCIKAYILHSKDTVSHTKHQIKNKWMI